VLRSEQPAPGATPGPPRPAAGILARGYAFVVVSLRYFIIGGWCAAVVAAILYFPPLSTASSGGLSELIPPGSAAARAESDAVRLFGFPLDAGVAIVQRDPHGMPAATQDRAVRQAIAVDRGLAGQSAQLADLARSAAALAQAGQATVAQVLTGPVSPGPPGGIPGLAGAFPLPNAGGLLHGTKERDTTVITFLFFRPGTSFGEQTAAADAYVHWFLNRPADDVVGVTGPVPAEYAQSQIIGSNLGWVELFTLFAIALIVGLRFRSIGAPLAALACADLPSLGRAAGLAGVRFEVAGQTALTGDSISSIFADLGRIALAIMLVTLVLLALFLRSLLAPVYLLVASILAVFATLGVTWLISQDILGYGSLVYFVPFAAGVLLVSLGSDYNVFVVGRIWEEARRRPVPDAVAVAAPQASRAITTAGVALAASFAMLAVIPLEQFRQIAIAMAVGVIVDAIIVRSLLVPALVALFGRLGMWPGNRRVPPVTAAAVDDAPARAGASG
jgi:hypothetical protein